VSVASPQLITLDTPALVEASAGTGKTYTITTYFVRAILEHDLAPEQILIVTYTKAATAELRVRARERIVACIGFLDAPSQDGDVLHGVVEESVRRLGRRETEARLRSALGQMDQAAILTIHGFCQRLLQDYPLSFGIDFDFEVAEDVMSMHRDLAVDFWATDLYDKPDWFLQALDDGKVSLEHLGKLANVAMMPGIEILGPSPAEVDEATLGRWEEARAAARQLWATHRQEVIDRLLQTKGLNGNSYKKKTIEEKWPKELDEFFIRTRFRTPPMPVQRLARGHFRMNKGHAEPEHPFFEACADLWETQQALAPSFAYAVFAFQQRFIEYARRHARARQAETAVLTYDDLLTSVYQRLDPSADTGNPAEVLRVKNEITAAYPMALVDEFQDTDSVQYGIFHALYDGGSVVYVGDPKQAIYAFRGADVFSYLEAASNVEGRRYTLAENRRSDPNVVHAVNTLFTRQTPPFLLEGIEMPSAVAHREKSRSTLGPGMELVFLDDETLAGTLATAVAPIVANEVALLLASGAQIDERDITPGDVAVLCRSNNQALAVTAALRELDVPVSLDGDSSVLSTEIADDLRAVLEAALMPGDSPAVRRALLTSLLRVSPYELATMGDDEWSKWVSRFHEWHGTWHSQGVVRFLEDMLQMSDAEQAIARHPAARRKLTDLLHVEEILLRGERERRRDPIALMQWFRRLNEDSPNEGMIASEDLQQRPDAESGAVRVSTIHKSKGLEYGVVYCPFTWNDASLWDFEKAVVKFHDEHRNIKIDLGSSDCKTHLAISENEAFSEALRLMYVAVTRAKYRCTLFWGRAKRWKSSALRYLLHGDEGIGKLDQEAMRADVEELANASGGTIVCRDPYTERAERRERGGPTVSLDARELTRTFSQAARIASFTSLTGHAEKTPRPSADASDTKTLFSGLRGGVRTGLLLHSILEHADFQNLGGDEAGALVERQLRDFGVDESLAPAVQQDLQTVAATPLFDEDGAPRLVDLRGDQQLRELEFTLSAGRPRLEGLVRIMKEHRAPTAAPDYHERLAGVGASALQSFLRGYIDLMFEWQGRWYVADYKSNSLPAYGPAEVQEAVQREHYVLQGQLYTAAAQRHLMQRLPGYDPAQHWGGALFLFLRGMNGASTGGAVFFERQSPKLLEATERWLGGES
jgi:exodeoxyribonuclease V beta subunit